MKIAILSDTHGFLRPELFPHLEGVEEILHAGDVGPAGLLVELEAFAPVTAVWGNTDGFELRHRLPEIAHLERNDHRIVVMHGHQLGMPTPETVADAHPDVDLVIFGHTHRPVIEQVGSVLAVNPGSCGPRRFDLHPTLALAHLDPGHIEVEVIEIRSLE